jgi:hypothetical protein
MSPPAGAATMRQSILTKGAAAMSTTEAHWAKLAFERYFLSPRKRGMVAF